MIAGEDVLGDEDLVDLVGAVRDAGRISLLTIAAVSSRISFTRSETVATDSTVIRTTGTSFVSMRRGADGYVGETRPRRGFEVEELAGSKDAAHR